MKFKRIALLTLLSAFFFTACEKANPISKASVSTTIDPQTDITDSIIDTIFRAYCVTEFGNGHRITAGQAAAVERIEVSVTDVISMEGIKYFTGLKYLNCSANLRLTELNLTENTALVTLICNMNALTLLNISKCTVLEDLNCGYNKLATLDIGSNTALVTLDCRDNQLTELNTSNNKALTFLNCESNRVSNLNVSNPLLTDLYCGISNILVALDVSKCTNLKYLKCSGSFLATLELPNSTKLKTIDCRAAKLTTLDISNCTHVNTLLCTHNPNLTTIYVWRGFTAAGTFYKDDIAHFVEK